VSTTHQIIQKYLDADFSERLYLFLEHRTLRQVFLDIEYNEVDAANESLSNSYGSSKSQQTILPSFYQNLVNFVKSIFAKRYKYKPIE